MAHAFHILDVFGESPYSGNQLAVVLDAVDLSTDQMQAIAAETNFSETTFVLTGRQDDDSFRVRIFTPGQELPFAGHPTLGTAWVIRHVLEGGRPTRVVLDLDVGPIPVNFESSEGRELGWLTAPPSTFGQVLSPPEIAPALGLEPAEIDAGSPVQQVTGGPSFLLVPLSSAAALERCRPHPGAFAELMARGLPPFVHVFCREASSSENDMAARFFFEANGVREDPATGSATGCLGFYLVKHDYLSSPEFSVRVEQGVLMGRPSLLRVQATRLDGSTSIRVGGQVFPIARGELLT